MVNTNIAERAPSEPQRDGLAHGVAYAAGSRGATDYVVHTRTVAQRPGRGARPMTDGTPAAETGAQMCGHRWRQSGATPRNPLRRSRRGIQRRQRRTCLGFEHGLRALDAFAETSLELGILLAGLDMLGDGGPDHLNNRHVVDGRHRLERFRLFR